MRALFVLLAGLGAGAAGANTVQDAQFWLNATVMGTLPGTRVAYFIEVQPRYSVRARNLSQLLLRPAVGYKVSDAVTVYGGYAHVILPAEGASDRNEERLFTQLSWTLAKGGAGNLSSRTRLEHRRLSTGRDTGWRLRELLRYSHALGGSGSGPGGLRALVWGELFVAFNDTDWGARSGFDQWRVFAGIEAPLKGRSTIEAGYLNQAINDPGGRTRMNHVASLSIFVRP